MNPINLRGLAATTLDRAIEIVCELCGVTFADLMATTPWRTKLRGERSEKRARVWWMLRQIPAMWGGAKWSYPDIARAFRVSHSTVIDGVKRWARRLAVEATTC